MAYSYKSEEFDWMTDAACATVGTEMFFPEKGGTATTAKLICSTCPVAKQCLQYALDNDEQHGIWGGYTDRERRKLKKERAVKATI